MDSKRDMEYNQSMKQTKLFIGALVAGFIALQFGHYYVTFLHEMNHLFAMAMTGNIPLALWIYPEGSQVLGRAYGIPITRFIPIIDSFILVSGSGLAVAAPAIVWTLGLRLKMQWLSGFWIPGIPVVLSDWGYGGDFKNINYLGQWKGVLLIVILLIYAIALWQTGEYYGRHIRSEGNRNIQPIPRQIRRDRGHIQIRT